MGQDPHQVDPELSEGPASAESTEKAAARSPSRTSRRELLVVGAVGAAALYLGLKRRTITRGKSYKGRVIVVGAGLAGLSAAWELERRGWDATVLDARQRIGGRCHTLRNFAGGQIAEAGGEFIDSTHREMRRFAAHFGLRLEDLRQGAERYEDLAYVGGRRQTLEQFYGGKAEREIERFYEQAFRLARGLDPANPAASGAAYDRRNVAELLDELGIAGRPREILDRQIRDEYAIEAEKLSLLFFLTETKVTWNTPESGVEAFHVHGGNDQIANGFARRLRRAPHLGALVTRVQLLSKGVRVTAGGEDFEGDHVLLAAALPGLRGVRFEPEAPEAVAGAIRELQYGPATKTPIQYERRFWRQEELSGDVFTDLPFSTAWEATDKQRGRRGILMAYSSGDAGLLAASTAKPKRIEATTAQLNQVYPGSRSLRGKATSIAWSNSPLNGGAYSAYAPGQMTDFWTALRRSYGAIHLAGEHTATRVGYMEGALESGLRAARRIDASKS